jgi:hypothetical protein
VNEASDLAAIEEIVAAFYETFDNRAPRIVDGERLRPLCMPDVAIRCLKDGAATALGLADFLEPRVALLSGGRLVEFHEWELEGETTILGNIAAHSSRYRKEGRLDGEPYSGGGRKLMQLCRLQGTWLISSVLWEDD